MATQHNNGEDDGIRLKEEICFQKYGNFCFSNSRGQYGRECCSCSRNISVRNCGQFLVYKLKRLLCVTNVTVATDCQVLHQVKIIIVNFTRAF